LTLILLLLSVHKFEVRIFFWKKLHLRAHNVKNKLLFSIKFQLTSLGRNDLKKHNIGPCRQYGPRNNLINPITYRHFLPSPIFVGVSIEKPRSHTKHHK